MKTAFYMWAILPIIWETYVIFNTEKVVASLKRIREKNKTGLLERTNEEKSLSYCMLGYLIWIFVGVFSTQWVLFLFIFITSFIPKKAVWLRRVDSAITVAVIMFIIINAYHLHINILMLFL